MGRRNTRRRAVDLSGSSVGCAVDTVGESASAHVTSSADHASTWELVEGAFFAQGVEDDLAAIQQYAALPAEAIFDIENHVSRKKRLRWLGYAVGAMGVLAVATIGIVRAAGHKSAAIAVVSGSGAGGPVAEALGASTRASMPSLPSGLGEAPGTSAAGAPAREPVPVQAEPAMPAPTVAAASTAPVAADPAAPVAVGKTDPLAAQAEPVKLAAVAAVAGPSAPAATAPLPPAPAPAVPAVAVGTPSPSPGAALPPVPVAAPVATAPVAAAPLPAPAPAVGKPAAIAAQDKTAEPVKGNDQGADPATLCRDGLQKKQSKAIVSSCGDAVEVDASLAPPLLKWAKAEFERGRTAVAANMARKIIQVEPANPNLAEAYVIVGTAEQESSRASAAKVAYRRYLDLAPRGYYANDVRSALKSL